MIKTQIQLEEVQYERLRKIAAAEHRSLADCVRECVALYLAQSSVSGANLDGVLGKFAPISDEDLKPHDRAWAEAILPKQGAAS